MSICPICDDTGLINSNASNPDFCYCSAGKKARRQWEGHQLAEKQGKQMPKPASFIDIANLDQVNANVDALRSSLLGATVPETVAPSKHPVVQLINQVAHPGHEITVQEATQLYDLAKAIENFLGALSPIGRNSKR
jgi:hypothetical protein